ncbi:MAG: ankyrin repeat domain-containing protein [Synergistaceae bacterium]|nr:ankyrin repeat domain-containing protein [Synergistaceae bacterium]
MQLRKQNELKKKCSVRAEGTIIDAYYKGGRKSRRPFIKFNYSADGAEYVQDVQVGMFNSFSMKQGKSVSVFYDPSDPNRFYFPENSMYANTLIMWFGYSAILMFIAVILIVKDLTPNTMATLPIKVAADAESAEFVNLCGVGTLQQIEAAIKEGADVNVKNNNGDTPLIMVAEKGNPEAIDMLIQAGADVNAINSDGWTPLMTAALYNKDPEVLNTLVKRGADVNAKTDEGVTPLMMAAYDNKNPEVLNVLIQAGAEVNARNNEGWTALMAAADNNKNPDVLNTLIKAGADVNAKNDDGETPLYLVVGTKEPEIVSLLLAAGATVSKNDVELAQKNELLKDNPIIEELKQRVK